MKRYLLWSQVQQRLTEHIQSVGKPYSFYEAAKELWEEGQFRCAPELPAVPFMDWDGTDLDKLERLLDQIPVDLDIFYHDFQQRRSISSSTQRINPLDVTSVRIAQDQVEGPHTHDSFEINYVARGTAQLRCGNIARALPAGSLCMISPHLVHDVVAGEGSILLSVLLPERIIENTLFRLLRQESAISDFFHFGLRDSRNGCMLFSDLNPREVLPLFRCILHESYAQREYSGEACADYLELLFIYLLRRGGEQHERYGEAQQRREGVPMLAILKHIQANYKTTSLNETAALFHYEASYLGKQIKANTGKNYGELVGELRMTDAKRLLRDTDLSVAKVAEASGFHSQVHFSRSFRGRFGMSPSTWRKGGKDAKTENVK